MIPETDSFYNSEVIPPQTRHSELLTFSEKGLKSSIDTNWSFDGDKIYFGQGQAKRTVFFDWGIIDVEKTSMVAAIKAFLMHASVPVMKKEPDDAHVRDEYLEDIYV